VKPVLTLVKLRCVFNRALTDSDQTFAPGLIWRWMIWRWVI
jgi:hypothetical protein